ncbi:MAG: TetR/AcrR family transcriptional regulator [Bacteroidetes bacterium]|nr:MAG: TetR/AcrR family transcriptional regulator [Bacteroidota bacterium]
MLSKADKTKRMIIEKSAPIFNKKGFAGTSMNDIIEATGLAKGGIYGNFRNKEEIAELAFDFAFEKVIEEIRIKIQPKKNTVDKLLAILDYYRNYSVKSPIEGGCPMVNFGADSDDTHPLIRERVASAMAKTVNELVHIIDAGKKRKEIKSSIDSSLTAEIIFSTINGGLMMSKANQNPKKLNRILDWLANWIEAEIRSECF